MLPFSIELKPGLPVAEQILFAVKKAVVKGQLRPGDSFPSVRVLSQELRINPNTAHKIVAALVEDGILTVRAGIGTVVAEERAGTAAARRGVLENETERLVVESRRAGLSLQDLLAAVRRHWSRTIRRAG